VAGSREPLIGAVTAGSESTPIARATLGLRSRRFGSVRAPIALSRMLALHGATRKRIACEFF
jgi:hypothetical protein